MSQGSWIAIGATLGMAAGGIIGSFSLGVTTGIISGAGIGVGLGLAAYEEQRRR